MFKEWFLWYFYLDIRVFNPHALSNTFASLLQQLRKQGHEWVLGRLNTPNLLNWRMANEALVILQEICLSPGHKVWPPIQFHYVLATLLYVIDFLPPTISHPVHQGLSLQLECRNEVTSPPPIPIKPWSTRVDFHINFYSTITLSLSSFCYFFISFLWFKNQVFLKWYWTDTSEGIRAHSSYPAWEALA